ncbi:MAG TPA: ATP-binding protein [Devosiaceae bacterium]|nr:ATP-binding protein [Devosiaceae bacterium]
MATLHLMVGLPCSGKTTEARKLEAEYSALRLTTDEWHVRLFGDDFADADDVGHERHNARHQVLESLLWDVAARALVLGTNVVLDFGCWSRSEREDFRTRANELGADFRIHFTDASDEALLKRLAARNAEHPEGTFRIAEDELKKWIRLFERPSRDELERP